MIRCILAVVILIPACASAEVLTAARVIRPNTVIEPEDISVLAKSFPDALGVDQDIVGLETKNTLYPGRPIRARDIGPVVLVKRNQPVTLVFRQGGLIIATDARALQRGAVGDLVRVMNMSSRTTVSGQVAEDGSVVVTSLRAGR